MTLISATLILLSLFGTIAAAKSSSPLNESDPSKKHLLSVVPFISVETVCQDRVILDFELWYEAWVVQYVQRGNDKPGYLLNGHIHRDVQEHLDQVKEYLLKLESIKPVLSNFPPLHTDIKITKLDSDINKILHNDLPNKFSSPEEQSRLQKQHGHYLPEFIQGLLDTPMDADLIFATGKAYKDDWDRKDHPEGQLMKEKINELATPLRATLRRVLKVFTNSDPTIYNVLSTEDKDLLQHFFDTFKFLLTPEEIQGEVLQGLVGSEQPKELKQKYFTPEVFQRLNPIGTSYSDKILRDAFLTLPTPTSDLENIHKAAKKLFFSWDFLKEFDGDDNDFQEGIPSEKRNRPARKQAKLRLLAYKVYLLARLEPNLLPHDKPADNQEILKKLFDFTLDNPNFDPIETPLGEMSEIPTARYGQLIPVAQFRRHYLPLLNFFCRKLTGCKLLEVKNKPTIVKNYEKYGNFEGLKSKKIEESLLPQEVVEEINKSIEDNEIAKLDASLEEIMDIEDEEPLEEDIQDTLPAETTFVNPRDDEKSPVHRQIDSPSKDDYSPLKIITLEDKSPKKDSPKLISLVKKGPAKVMTSVKPKHEELFAPIITKFLPPTGEITEKSRDFVNKFLDKVEATENDQKKSIMRSLLIKHILRRYKDEEVKKVDPKVANPATDIVFLVTDKMVTKLRNSYSFEKAEGLKNFFMRAINPELGMNFKTVSPKELAMFKNDIIFFVYFATEDRFARAAKEQPRRADFAEYSKSIKNTINVLNSYFFTGAQASMQEAAKRSAVRNSILRNPLIMEQIPSYEFLINFFDFFNYFANIESKAESVYADYGLIFMNFYNFLATLRTDIFEDIKQPHQFVLDKLEACLLYTERVEDYTQQTYSSVCKLSHRKYAEMYYFYKVYLLSTNKQTDVDLRSFPQSHFDTHTRTFINFLLQYGPFQHSFSEACGNSLKEPICFVWSFANILINYIHNPSLTSDYITGQFEKVWEQGNTHMKFNVLSAIEAMTLNVANGNVKDYEKVLSLIKDLERKDIKIFAFTQAEVPLLANYLKRTFKKLTFEGAEVAAATAVQTILRVQPTEKGVDPLNSYLVHGGVVYLSYVKFFLLLASENRDYERIAKFIVDNNAGVSLIRMNSPKNHQEYISLINYIGSGSLAPNQQFEAIRTFMREKYEADHKVCVSEIQSNFLGSQTGDLEEFDPLKDLYDSMEDESEQNVKLEDAQFGAVNSDLVLYARKRSEVIVYEQKYLIEVEKDGSIFDQGLTDNNPIVVEIHHEYGMNGGDGLEVGGNIRMILNGKEIEKEEGIDRNSLFASQLQNLVNKAQKVEESEDAVSNGDNLLDPAKILEQLNDPNFIKQAVSKKGKKDKKRFI